MGIIGNKSSLSGHGEQGCHPQSYPHWYKKGDFVLTSSQGWAPKEIEDLYTYTGCQGWPLYSISTLEVVLVMITLSFNLMFCLAVFGLKNEIQIAEHYDVVEKLTLPSKYCSGSSLDTVYNHIYNFT